MNDGLGKKIVITSAAALVGVSLKGLAKKKWENLYDEEPPTIHPSEEINWKKVLLWSVITGTVISSAKLATKRYLTLKLE